MHSVRGKIYWYHSNISQAAAGFTVKFEPRDREHIDEVTSTRTEDSKRPHQGAAVARSMKLAEFDMSFRLLCMGILKRS